MGKIAVLAGNHEVGEFIALTLLNTAKDKLGCIFTEKRDWTILTHAQSRTIPCFEYDNEDKVLELCEKNEVTTLILAWWPKIVKILDKSYLTVINTHPSLLPYNRGKHPYYWAIMDGTPFGVTIHKVEAGVDTGPILWQKEIKVTPIDTGSSLYDRSIQEMKILFNDNLDRIIAEDWSSSRIQEEASATGHKANDFTAPILTPETFCLVGPMIDDLRARTFNNPKSGRKINIDGKIYTIKVHLEEYKG